jgi:hypothetical protein
MLNKIIGVAPASDNGADTVCIGKAALSKVGALLGSFHQESSLNKKVVAQYGACERRAAPGQA